MDVPAPVIIPITSGRRCSRHRATAAVSEVKSYRRSGYGGAPIHTTTYACAPCTAAITARAAGGA